MTDVWFVVAGWSVILGGMTAYAVALLRRGDAARRDIASAFPADDELPEDRG
jgi:hypothetical protein